MSQEFYQKLCGINPGEGQVLRKEPMKKHTTFRIGGPAEYFCLPETAEQLAATISACREAGEDYYILGNGSNVLVSDKGYCGVVIQLFQNQSEIRFRRNAITAPEQLKILCQCHPPLSIRVYRGGVARQDDL